MPSGTRLVAAEPPHVEAAVERLLDLALVWQSPGGLRPLTGVADCLTGGAAAGVSGLRPLTEGASVAAAAARLDELVSALHRHLATAPPALSRPGIRYDAADLPVPFPGLHRR